MRILTEKYDSGNAAIVFFLAGKLVKSNQRLAIFNEKKSVFCDFFFFFFQIQKGFDLRFW